MNFNVAGALTTLMLLPGWILKTNYGYENGFPAENHG